tara:strand:+ start:450 stop:1430 length:981 start_codon:yes stop_codon:yes gene_type:complete
MKVFALTFGNENCPSTNYRLIQYKEHLLNDGIELDHEIAKSFKDFKKLAGYDLVILQKTILSASKIRKIAKNAKRLIYDADDRIWLRPFRKHNLFTQIRINHRMRKICKYAQICMVANEVIAKDIISYGGKPSVVPMALDGKIWFPKEEQNEKIVIGWTGAPANLSFLEKILHPLRDVLIRNSDVKLVIHCGHDPCFENLDYEYIPYIPGKEAEVVRSFDIGLLPLPSKDPFVDGKSPIKGIQYLASGLAIISAKTHSSKNIFKNLDSVEYADNEHKWLEIISSMVGKKESILKASEKSRQFFHENYDISSTYKILRHCITKFLQT